jgi:ATP-dependent DNA helicase RecQ
MTVARAKQALKKYFGYDQFRSMQEAIIQRIYNGKDALVLMPTGGGKSICYQIPAVTIDGVCIVVSPLISLMKDQVEGLRANGVAAAFLNSSLTSAEQQMVEDDLFNGNINLLYVSPEKMVSQSFFPLLRQAKVNLFAIDEAHCISSWGHDFRPEYKKLKFLKQQFPEVPMVALTATADKVTRRDIIQQLRLNAPKIFLDSFDRPNISLSVRPGQKKFEQIIDFLRLRPKQAGIVYCLSRKNTEEVATKLRRSGYKAAAYHAGLPDQERSKVQEDFIRDEVEIVCATIAFGMGIDKSNVRWIIHYNLPKNLESYYQEIGRAGRDGLAADTLLFYSFRDVMVLRDIIQNNNSVNEAVQLSKLERMQQYAEALICRRKILLNYFSENLEKDCGNCDVCKNPPEYFNGTVIAQKALSAVARLQERVGVRMLIDVLRGSRRQEILQLQYDKIKTYGIGGDISAFDWQHLISQLINLGFLEIAYDQRNALKITPASKEVLFENRQVHLVKLADIKQRQEEEKAKVKTKTVRERVRDELFELLRELRRSLAVKQGIPPYLVFSDASLEEMAAKKPLTEFDFSMVSGVGEKKLKQYGAEFMKVILDFVSKKADEGVKIQGATQLQTYQMYKRGFSPEQIALQRDMTEQTVYNHLVQLYAKGKDIDIKRFVKTKELKQIIGVVRTITPPFKLREIHEALNEEIPYHKIRFALAYYYKS